MVTEKSRVTEKVLKPEVLNYSSDIVLSLLGFLLAIRLTSKSSFMAWDWVKHYPQSVISF